MEINKLLKLRLEAKLKKRYEIADEKKEELDATYGVFVNDKLKGWRSDGGAFPTHARVDGDGDDEYSEEVDEEAVLQKLAERALARKARDYDTADA